MSAGERLPSLRDVAGKEFIATNDPDTLIRHIFTGVLTPFHATKSDLRRERKGWPEDDWPLEDYFKDVTFRDGSLFDVLDKTIGRNPNNIGLDIAGGSNGAALKGLMDRGYIGRGLYTNFLDRRDPALPNPKAQLITGDLTKVETWRDITKWQQREIPEGFAVGLHRPLLGLQRLPPLAYYALAASAVRVMRSGSVFIIQIPLNVSNAESTQQRLLYRAIRALPRVQAVELAASNSQSKDYQHCAIYLKPQLPEPDL